jgi:NodT family efflux transporter outer membrane factor (OMF) lipoprotein
VKIAEARFKFGSTTELDTKQAQTLLYSTLASIPEIQANIRQLRNAIAVLLGITPNHVDAIIGGTGPIPRVPDSVTVGIPAELLRRRPDIRQAELDAAAQSARIGVARSDLYPSFFLFGTVGLQSTSNSAAKDNELFDADAVFFNGGPGFSWNILNYGRLKNEVRVQDARFQQTLVSYRNTVLEAVREAEDAMTGFLRTREQVGYLKSSVAASQRAVDIALLQYQEGAADYTRVLNTQESLFREQAREVTSRGEAVGNVIALYKALGGGWQVRIGDEIIPAETRNLMAERTNWGQLLDTRTDPALDSEAARKNRRKVAW